MTRATEYGENSLRRMSDAIQDAGRKRLQEEQSWEKSIGFPIVFIPDTSEVDGQTFPGPEGYGIGYFTYKGGVMSVRRYSNGYSRHSVTYYPDHLIDLLIKIRGEK